MVQPTESKVNDNVVIAEVLSQVAGRVREVGNGCTLVKKEVGSLCVYSCLE